MNGGACASLGRCAAFPCWFGAFFPSFCCQWLWTVQMLPEPDITYRAATASALAVIVSLSGGVSPAAIITSRIAASALG